ncbi:proline dehydrogenase [candidate division KSB1 bacterium]|nr:proline dehydrogenase [candidate division KSB1 bacterium]
MSILNRCIVSFMPLVPKPIVRLVSKRYVAGSTLAEAIETVKSLNSQGMCATMDLLGESSHDKESCNMAVNEYLNVLEAIDKEKLDCNISIKLTQLGLLIDHDLCYENISKIVAKAASVNNFVRVDMEDSSVTDQTIDLFLKLKKEYDNVGIVIQAYMRQSLSDVRKLSSIKSNFRLCKGIYDEPRKIAYKDPQIVNDNFAYLIRVALQAGSYVGIATHDEKVVWQSLKLIDELDLERNQYEFQMLLGVDPELRSILVNDNHRLRVYVPYGKEWYAYSMRRLKENPKIAIYIIRALFGLR